MRVIYRQSPSDEFPMPQSQEEVGRRMDPQLSQPAVSRIMKRLQDRSTIVGYTVDISFRHVGLPVKFFLQIKILPGTIAETARYVSRMDEVWDLHRTSEDFSLFATVRTENVDHYNRFLKNLYNNESVLDTQSQISLEEWFVPVR
jgi:DNA-binding Lrp family transcriptional regulator